jgi:hypothetical protein
MSVADWRGFSQILFMLIACPQSLHVIRVPPAMLLVVVYMPQDYASSVASAESIRTATTDFGCFHISVLRTRWSGGMMTAA